MFAISAHSTTDDLKYNLDEFYNEMYIATRYKPSAYIYLNNAELNIDNETLGNIESIIQKVPNYKTVSYLLNVKQCISDMDNINALLCYNSALQRIFYKGAYDSYYAYGIEFFPDHSQPVIDALKMLENITTVVLDDDNCTILRCRYKSSHDTIYVFTKKPKLYDIMLAITKMFYPDLTDKHAENLKSKLKENYIPANLDESFNVLGDYKRRYVEDNKRYCLQDIDSYLKRYNEALNKCIRLEKELEQINNDMIGFKSAVEKYIKSGIITKLNPTNTSLRFKIDTTLFNYSELSIKRRISKMEDSPFKQFLTDAFTTETYTIPISTKVMIGSDGIVNSGDRMPLEYKSLKRFIMYNNITKLPNPHIVGYNCFGTNGPAITKLYKTNKYEEMMQALIATVGNINFNDSIVTGHFFNMLEDMIKEKDNIIKIIKNTETGEEYTAKEYLELKGIN